MARNQGSTLFADGDTQNTIVTYNFRLEMISREQLLVLNDM